MFADAIAEAARSLPEEVRSEARLVFTAHSIPLRAVDRCGSSLYPRQVLYASELVAAAAGYPDYDVVWQSRSGPPQVPWLEPDVSEHLSALAEAGAKAVIVCPVGFVADHIEVIWDLDSELAAQAGNSESRSPGPRRRTHSPGSPVSSSTCWTKRAKAANRIGSTRKSLGPNAFLDMEAASMDATAPLSVKRALTLPGRLQDRADRC